MGGVMIEWCDGEMMIDDWWNVVMIDGDWWSGIINDKMIKREWWNESK